MYHLYNWKEGNYFREEFFTLLQGCNLPLAKGHPAQLGQPWEAHPPAPALGGAAL